MAGTRNTFFLRRVSPLFTVSALVSSTVIVVVGAAVVGCASSPSATQDTKSAQDWKADSKEVFTPSWSSNAATPPEPGAIKEVGAASNLDPLIVKELEREQNRARVAAAGAEPKQDPSANSWTIVIAVFRGDNNFETASQALMRVRREGGLPDAYLQRRGPSTVIAYGKYTSADDPRAQADIQRIQQMVVGGATPYALTYLCPPFGGAGGAIQNQYDLRMARKQFASAAVYTLQIGWYGREDLPQPKENDLKESRKAAEEAVSRLRQEGELAYFYHGPNRSMVTVGVFDSSDFDPVKKPGLESPKLRDAKTRHPLNLYNGAGYRYKAAGMSESKLLPSGLVKIPDK